MSAENARSTDSQEIAPLPIQRVQHQRAEPDVRRLRHPDSLVFGNGRGDDLLGGKGMGRLHGSPFDFMPPSIRHQQEQWRPS